MVFTGLVAILVLLESLDTFSEAAEADRENSSGGSGSGYDCRGAGDAGWTHMVENSSHR
jgi:hypothetical protein